MFPPSKTVPTDIFLFQCLAVTGGSVRGPNSSQESPESIHVSVEYSPSSPKYSVYAKIVRCDARVVRCGPDSLPGRV